jgi:outer membrane protein, multidrug efflux system
MRHRTPVSLPDLGEAWKLPEPLLKLSVPQPFPLTPALSPEERENHPPRCNKSRRSGISSDGQRGTRASGERAGVRGNRAHAVLTVSGCLRLLCFTLLLLAVAGCAVGPNYRRPPVDAPETFRGAGTATNSLADYAWWRLFNDPALHELIRVALTNNYDIRIAVTRVEQARALWAENRSLFLPQVNYAAGVGRGKNVQNNQPSNTGGQTGTGIFADGNISWELDLFGRIRRLNESARAQFLASQEARRDVTAVLVSEVASAYFQLLALDQELLIAQESTNSFGQSLRLFSERYHGGVASKLEVASAEALQAVAATSALDLQRQIVAQENLLCVLLGLNPGPVARGHALLGEELPPEIPPGLPSALLERRPDIRQAEQSLRSANAAVGVAKADFFPRLTLTGLLGQTSPELSTFTAGGNTAWSIAAGLTGPIFQGGLLRAQYRGARAAWDEARLQYQSTILTAFRGVADALTARQQYAAERGEQTRAVAAYQEAVKLANERYVQGRASYYEVLQEQQSLFPAETALTQIQLNQLLAVVQLYRALGGGWSAP